MKINIEVIAHAKQRYETPGDWFWDSEGVLQIRVSKLPNPKFERLIIIHELVEILIETARQNIDPQRLLEITEESDKAFESGRTDDSAESGYRPDNPVYHGHMAASAIEHIAGMLLGVDYNKYSEAVAALLGPKQ